MSRWTKWTDRGVSRRAFLGGAGATVALPVLSSLLPSRARAAGPEDVRLLFYYVPNGMHMPAWTPDGEGLDWEPSEILAPLAAHQDRVSVLSGLDNLPARVPGVPGDHARGTGSFLTCTTVVRTEGDEIGNGISIDQVVAQAIGGGSTFPSLQLGTSGGASVGGCDSGYSCAYTRNISWAGEATPLPKVTSPDLVFNRLFAGFEVGLTEAERARRRLYRSSVLDTVTGDADRLMPLLGRSDQLKLDEYLTAVRELELRIEADANSGCQAPDIAGWEDHTSRVRAMNDLLVAALTCGQTRIASFMLDNAASNRSYEFLGVPESHHQLSHHGQDPLSHAGLTAIGTWEVEQLAHLLDGLAAVTEGEGSLLDNTLVYFASELADGDAHHHTGLPVVLAGGGAHLGTGQHRVYEGRPMADLFLTMAATAGVSLASFGDSTGALDLS